MAFRVLKLVDEILHRCPKYEMDEIRAVLSEAGRGLGVGVVLRAPCPFTPLWLLPSFW